MSRIKVTITDKLEVSENKKVLKFTVDKEKLNEVVGVAFKNYYVEGLLFNEYNSDTDEWCSVVPEVKIMKKNDDSEGEKLVFINLEKATFLSLSSKKEPRFSINFYQYSEKYKEFAINEVYFITNNQSERSQVVFRSRDVYGDFDICFEDKRNEEEVCF